MTPQEIVGLLFQFEKSEKLEDWISELCSFLEAGVSLPVCLSVSTHFVQKLNGKFVS